MRANIWILIGIILCGCASVQNSENTVQMAADISKIREDQVLGNVSKAITDRDMVPSQILLGTGQATVSTGLTPTIKLPNFNFSKPTKELDISATDTWNAQWQFTSVTAADDLRSLRNIYALIVTTDEQYEALEAYWKKRYPKTANEPDAGLIPFLSLLPREAPGLAPQATKPGEQTPLGTIITASGAKKYIIDGDSIDCMLYQATKDQNKRGSIPFNRWLFWRGAGADWQPTPPKSKPTSLGFYGGWEIGVTSRACFDDFVILVQGVTPTANNVNSLGTKLVLPLPSLSTRLSVTRAATRAIRLS
jgi:hypothetical protein